MLHFLMRLTVSLIVPENSFLKIKDFTKKKKKKSHHCFKLWLDNHGWLYPSAKEFLLSSIAHDWRLCLKTNYFCSAEKRLELFLQTQSGDVKWQVNGSMLHWRDLMMKTQSCLTKVSSRWSVKHYSLSHNINYDGLAITRTTNKPAHEYIGIMNK